MLLFRLTYFEAHYLVKSNDPFVYKILISFIYVLFKNLFPCWHSFGYVPFYKRVEKNENGQC